MRRAGTCAVVVVAALSVAGCGAGHGASAGDTSRSVPLNTSSWKPGDIGMQALIAGTLEFTRHGCPTLGHARAVVWPAGYSAVVKADGEEVVVTADGREIDAGDTVTAGGGSVPRNMVGNSGSTMPCIPPGGGDLMFIQSTVSITRGP